MDVWGPSKNRPSHSPAVDKWGTHFALPVVRGETKVKVHVVTQAQIVEVLSKRHDRNEEHEEHQTKRVLSGSGVPNYPTAGRARGWGTRSGP
eukprot:3020404-Pyramimonas_sp.AAC.1